VNGEWAMVNGEWAILVNDIYFSVCLYPTLSNSQWFQIFGKMNWVITL